MSINCAHTLYKQFQTNLRNVSSICEMILNYNGFSPMHQCVMATSDHYMAGSENSPTSNKLTLKKQTV